MKKDRIANGIMVVVILVIVSAGIWIVGNIRGWFDVQDNTRAVLAEVRGVVKLQRDGVSYSADGEMYLRASDRIICDPGASAVIQIGEDSLALGERADIEVTEPSIEDFRANVNGGEIFADCDGHIILSFADREIALTETAACLSIRKGAQSISVYAGIIDGVSAGQKLEWIGDGIPEIRELSLQELNDFNIQQIRKANESRKLCFTDEELTRLQADRAAQRQQQVNAKGQESEAEESQSKNSAPEESSTEENSWPENEISMPEESSAPEEESSIQEVSVPEDMPQGDWSMPEESSETVEPPEESSEETSTAEEMSMPEEANRLTCTISIRCDTVLEHWDQLDPAKAGCVPSDGMILYGTTVEFTEGETVFDVLSSACSTYGIQLEYSWTPMYDSYYVEGINNLYELDCGSESGWVYQVNGWFPNYGCSGYTVQDGDIIVWYYSCSGLGADVGA